MLVFGYYTKLYCLTGITALVDRITEYTDKKLNSIRKKEKLRYF
jgi:hypothetical protein